MAFQTLFGSEVPEVARHDGTTLSVSKLGGAHHKFVILYFSAHWCPPCKRFTPILAEFYKLLKATRDDVEIVFLSSDKSEEEFKEYFETMPWYAMPYQARRTKTKLSGKFKVEGIPTLLVLTGDGEEINKDAMSGVYEARDNLNAALESFPWKPKTMGEILSSNPVITAKDGSAVNLSSLSSFALYFSAHWCPPCRGFTPKLAERYESLQRLHPNTQIVFVSSDNTEEEFDAYYASMPWAALAFADRATKEALSELCEVSSIPSLVTIDGATLQIINTNGREASDEDEAGTNFPWLPTPLPLVAELGMKADVVEALNARVCYFLSIPEDAEGVSSTTAEEIIASFKAAAPLVDAKRGDDDVLKVSFFTVPSSGLGLLERVMAVSKPENVEGVYKVQPLVLATLLGPSKQAAVLTKDLTVASNIVDFAHQFYVKAAGEVEV